MCRCGRASCAPDDGAQQLCAALSLFTFCFRARATPDERVRMVGESHIQIPMMQQHHRAWDAFRPLCPVRPRVHAHAALHSARRARTLRSSFYDANDRGSFGSRRPRDRLREGKQTLSPPHAFHPTNSRVLSACLCGCAFACLCLSVSLCAEGGVLILPSDRPVCYSDRSGSPLGSTSRLCGEVASHGQRPMTKPCHGEALR